MLRGTINITEAKTPCCPKINAIAVSLAPNQGALSIHNKTGCTNFLNDTNESYHSISNHLFRFARPLRVFTEVSNVHTTVKCHNIGAKMWAYSKHEETN
jgi:hypothetical protein